MIRPSPISGSWYAGTKESLQDQIQNLFNDSKFGPGFNPRAKEISVVQNDRLMGVISPHAGLVYSGSIAAHSYLHLAKNYQNLDSVIIVGPNHRGRGAPISIYPEGSWETPLGLVEIDTDIVEFTKSFEFGAEDQIEFEFDSQSSEHSIEIQLPFLQYLYPNIKFVPICLSDQSPEISSVVAELLFKIKQNFTKLKIAIVASSDLSHEQDYELLVANDKKMIAVIKNGSADEVEAMRMKNRVTMCGYGPIQAILKLANLYGKSKITKLAYANSRQIAGGSGYTVGYPSFAVEYL